jgi:hypothetical protein
VYAGPRPAFASTAASRSAVRGTVAGVPAFIFLAIVLALSVLGLVLTGWGLFAAVITTQRDPT